MMNMLQQNDLYPLKFYPLYFTRMWGGTQLSRVLNRELPETDEPIGESWELVDRDDVQSQVSNGPLAGRTIRELMEYYGRALLGGKWNGNRFPLLVKLIDAGQRLSLQVHPDEQACARIGDGAEPKTEMWYILSAQKGAKILAGLSNRATKRRLIDNLNSPDVENLLHVYASQPLDAYFISAGTLHAIGEGNLLLEIQQNSDTTYRVSDWGRVDQNGNSRELHVQKAMESIDFMNRTTPRIPGVVGTAPHNRKFPVVNRCRFFTVDSLALVSPWRDETSITGSFHYISAINHPVRLTRSIEEKENGIDLLPGESALIPACYGQYAIHPLVEGTVTVLRTTL